MAEEEEAPLLGRQRGERNGHAPAAQAARAAQAAQAPAHLTEGQKRVSLRVLIFFWFLSGVEYAVILPSVWSYLQSLGATHRWSLSIALSVFPMANFIVSPAYGRLADTSSIKRLLLLSNLCEMGGNLIYFVATSQFMVFEGRFLAGLGAGSGSAVFAYVSRVTTDDERTKAMGSLMASRPIGVLIGPAFNFLLVRINATIGGFEISKLNVPGLFMAVVWVACQAVIWRWFTDIPPFRSRRDADEPASGRDKALSPPITNGPSSGGGAEAPIATSEYLNVPVMVLLLNQLLVMFTQTALETFLTPFTQEYFGWAQVQNSIMFIVLSAITLVSFISIQFLTKMLKDRSMLLLGVSTQLAGLVWLLVTLGGVNPKDHDRSRTLAFFAIGVGILLIGMPFVFVSTPSLQSKFTTERTQGRGQGVRRMAVSCAMIVGPLWGGTTSGNLHLMLGGLVGLFCIALSIVLLGWQRLDPSHRRYQDAKDRLDEDSPALGSIN